MNTLRVNSLCAVARSRLATVSRHTLLLQAAQHLSETHIGLVVVCEPGGAMSGVIGKSDIVRQIGHCAGSACHTLASNLNPDDPNELDNNNYKARAIDVMGGFDPPPADPSLCHPESTRPAWAQPAKPARSEQ